MRSLPVSCPHENAFSEIIYCDFSNGLELVSVMSPVTGKLPIPQPSDPGNATSTQVRGPGAQLSGPHNHTPGARPEGTFHGLRSTDHPSGDPEGLVPGIPPLIPPPGWKGTLPFIGFEAKRAGTWHNDFPGLSQVHADPSTLVSFFDPSLRSLVEARRNMTRNEYAAGNASQEDIDRVRQDISEMALRAKGAGSGVDWVGLARTIQERFEKRLPYLQHLLHKPVINASTQAADVRRQLIVSLMPYMHKEEIGEAQWFADIAHDCAARFTKRLPVSRFTKQEETLYHAVGEVLHEICRVHTSAWADAFDVESKSAEAAAELLERWRDEFDALVEWLDWPVWIQCHPACEVDVRRPFLRLVNSAHARPYRSTAMYLRASHGASQMTMSLGVDQWMTMRFEWSFYTDARWEALQTSVCAWQLQKGVYRFKLAFFAGATA